MWMKDDLHTNDNIPIERQNLLMGQWYDKRKLKIDHLLKEMGKDAFYSIAKMALTRVGRIKDPDDAVVESYISTYAKTLSIYMDSLYHELERKRGVK